MLYVKKKKIKKLTTLVVREIGKQSLVECPLYGTEGRGVRGPSNPVGWLEKLGKLEELGYRLRLSRAGKHRPKVVTI